MIQMIKGDITKVQDVDAIVNAANKTLLGGGGVDGAIHKAAGKGLLWECMKLHGCKLGEAKITKGYNLPCKYVIHTVGPVWKGGMKGEEEALRNCYRNTMELARQYGIRRIAYPSISTGVFHFPIENAAMIALDEVCSFFRQNGNVFDLVEWVLFDDETYEVYQRHLYEMMR